MTEKLILAWTNKADLFRVKGVGEQYSDLLEAAGMDTVVELSARRADNLAAKMAEVNAEKKLVRQVPTEAQVAAWIEDARTLPRVMTYSLPRVMTYYNFAVEPHGTHADARAALPCKVAAYSAYQVLRLHGTGPSGRPRVMVRWVTSRRPTPAPRPPIHLSRPGS